MAGVSGPNSSLDNSGSSSSKVKVKGNSNVTNTTTQSFTAKKGSTISYAPINSETTIWTNSGALNSPSGGGGGGVIMAREDTAKPSLWDKFTSNKILLYSVIALVALWLYKRSTK